VPATRELLFGKIAIAQGYCTQDQLDGILKLQLQMQSPHRPAPRLGELLVEKGVLSAEQLETVLNIQRQNQDASGPLARRRKEEVLFGRLAVREGLATDAQVEECLKIREGRGEVRTLGEIMVDKGFLTPEQVKSLLSRQLKRIMSCPACTLSFTVLSVSEGRTIDCPRCKGPLREGKPTDSTRTDAEFSTQVIRTVKAGLPVKPPPRPDPRATARRVQAKCMICDHAFEGPVGPDGRVACPQCHTTFAPR
jgi:hypothetical protein